MMPLTLLSERHHRHHRHQSLSFNDLRVTQVPLTSSPDWSPLSALTNGDEYGDAWVAQSRRVRHRVTIRNLAIFGTGEPAVTMVTQIPLLSLS